jgi:hypothetical protein
MGRREKRRVMSLEKIRHGEQVMMEMLYLFPRGGETDKDYSCGHCRKYNEEECEGSGLQGEEVFLCVEKRIKESPWMVL